MIKRIGCFHFVENYADPFGSLCDALSEHGDVNDSLLVVPEAFNNGKPYYDEPRGQPLFSAKDTLHELGKIAAGHGLILVAGILAWPFSSAYLIAKGGNRLLCHKKCDDSTKHYEPSTGRPQDEYNPIVHEGIGVGVLMCNEVDLYTKGLAARLDECGCARHLICIPAWMSAHYFGTDRLMADHWEGKYVVLANSNPYGCGSFIADTRRQCHRVGGRTNQILLKTWDELDRPDSEHSLC